MLYMIQWTDMQSNPLSSQLCMKCRSHLCLPPKSLGLQNICRPPTPIHGQMDGELIPHD